MDLVDTSVWIHALRPSGSSDIQANLIRRHIPFDRFMTTRVGYPSKLMEDYMPKVLHPHITNNAGICAGRPHIAGTRFSVHRVIQYVLHQGVTPEELRAAFPHLSLGAIYDALAYYYDNRDEVDAESTADAALDTEHA